MNLEYVNAASVCATNNYAAVYMEIMQSSSDMTAKQ